MLKKRVAIVGYGQFGRFMAKHLRPYASIVPIDSETNPDKIANCDVVIFAVPWNNLETAVKTVKPFVTKGTLIIDVTSVKQKPLQLLEKVFAGHELLGTHPIFGPQSGKNGIAGLPIVLCNVSFSKARYTKVKAFLKKDLGLNIIEQTPKQHDSEMARVQALTHLIGRTISELDIKSYATNTKSYKHLLELRELLKNDSWELFKTIQNANPEAKVVRDTFLTTARDITKRLNQ